MNILLFAAILPMLAAAIKRELLALPEDTNTPWLREFCTASSIAPKTLVVGKYNIQNVPGISTLVSVSFGSFFFFGH